MLLDYLKWEKYFKKQDFTGIAELNLPKSFAFYTIRLMSDQGVEDASLYKKQFEHLTVDKLDLWEKVELSLYPQLSQTVSDVNIEQVYQSIIDSVKEHKSKTLVHVHVPKAAGTSVNHSVIKEFYKDTIKLPGNNTPRALQMAFTKLLGKVPYLSTGHLPLNWLMKEISCHQEAEFFMVHRSHSSRLNSMRNQILSSVLTSNFYRRPYAYTKQFYMRELRNRYLFPVHNTLLVNTMSSSLAYNIEDARLIKEKYGVKLISIGGLNDFIMEKLNVKLQHVKKNRTHNLSRFLPELPKASYEVDQSLFK